MHEHEDGPVIEKDRREAEISGAKSQTTKGNAGAAKGEERPSNLDGVARPGFVCGFPL